MPNIQSQILNNPSQIPDFFLVSFVLQTPLIWWTASQLEMARRKKIECLLGMSGEGSHGWSGQKMNTLVLQFDLHLKSHHKKMAPLERYDLWQLLSIITTITHKKNSSGIKRNGIWYMWVQSIAPAALVNCPTQLICISDNTKDTAVYFIAPAAPIPSAKRHV